MALDVVIVVLYLTLVVLVMVESLPVELVVLLLVVLEIAVQIVILEVRELEVHLSIDQNPTFLLVTVKEEEIPLLSENLKTVIFLE